MSFSCPSCGNEKQLQGEREGDLVHIACLAYGHEWTHDPWSCPRCGERMHAARKPLIQKARGTQQSIIGYRSTKECPRCDVDGEREDGWMSAS